MLLIKREHAVDEVTEPVCCVSWVWPVFRCRGVGVTASTAYRVAKGGHGCVLAERADAHSWGAQAKF